MCSLLCMGKQGDGVVGCFTLNRARSCIECSMMVIFLTTTIVNVELTCVGVPEGSKSLGLRERAARTFLGG